MTQARKPATPVKEEALIIRSIRHGESSRIVTLFGGTRGKFAVIAKGARRGSVTATGGSIGPPHRVEVVVHFKPSRSVQTLGQVTLLDAYPRVKQDLTLTGYAAVVLELLNRAFTDGEANPDAFKAATGALHDLEQGSYHPRVVLWRLQVAMIKATGFALDPYPCPVCGQEPAVIGRSNLLLLDRGAICCKDCRPSRGTSIPLSGESVSLLRRITNDGDPGLDRLKPSRMAISELTRTLERFLRYHHPGIGKLPALGMLDSLETPQL